MASFRKSQEGKSLEDKVCFSTIGLDFSHSKGKPGKTKDVNCPKLCHVHHFDWMDYMMGGTKEKFVSAKYKKFEILYKLGSWV